MFIFILPILYTPFLIPAIPLAQFDNAARINVFNAERTRYGEIRTH
jgi:hypothetical protein